VTRSQLTPPSNRILGQRLALDQGPPIVAAALLDGRGHADLAAHDLDDGHDGQQEHQHGEELAEAPALFALVGEGHVGGSKGLGEEVRAGCCAYLSLMLANKYT
jgi:hypothetical protein